jgi:hypothetical protein
MAKGCPPHVELSVPVIVTTMTAWAPWQTLPAAALSEIDPWTAYVPPDRRRRGGEWGRLSEYANWRQFGGSEIETDSVRVTAF